MLAQWYNLRLDTRETRILVDSACERTRLMPATVTSENRFLSANDSIIMGCGPGLSSSRLSQVALWLPWQNANLNVLLLNPDSSIGQP